MGKTFNFAPEIKNVPGANRSGTARIAFEPSDGRLLNFALTVTKNGALATVAEMQAAMTELRLILTGGGLKNAETVRTISAAEYFAILDANGYTNEAGLFPMFLAEYFRATVQDEELIGLEMRRYDKVEVEIDITQDANPIDIQCDVETADELKTIKQDGKDVQVVGIISHTRQTEKIGGGDPIIKLDPCNGPLNRLFLYYPATMALTRVRVLRGDNPIYDRYNTALRPGLKQQLKPMGLRIPANVTINGVAHKVFPVVFDNNQQLRNAQNPNGLRLQVFNDTGADALRIVRETQLAR